MTDSAQQPPSNTPGAPNAALKENAPAEQIMYERDHKCAAHLTVLDREQALVDDGPDPRRKIAVCGFASSSRDMIPVNDPTWEIWGMNQLYRHIPRADRWFDIHWNWDKEVVPGTDYPVWLRSCGIPLYMVEPQKDLPTSMRYPLKRMVELGGDYFTSTVAFMGALAVDVVDGRVAARLRKEIDLAARLPQTYDPMRWVERQKQLYGEYTIGLFGIDLVVEEEYFHQRPCAEFWVGLAVGRYINLFIPAPSALCKQSYRYGYEPEAQSVVKVSEITQHHSKLTEERDRLIKELYLHDGALQVDEYWRRVVELRTRGAEVRL